MARSKDECEPRNGAFTGRKGRRISSPADNCPKVVGAFEYLVKTHVGYGKYKSGEIKAPSQDAWKDKLLGRRHSATCCF